ncbi:MAG TPA: cytochrome c biogenesis protein ResB [Candidatus Lustribacter sp.]|nr:cytochrome c biogenesis protein ResB [Candidatus Lustribacter sp.]
MSTGTATVPAVTQPPLGPAGWARWAWRQLTSMRTALFLLMLLAVAAVPGSVFPQRSIDAGRVADYLNDNPTLGGWLDRLSFFDVYSSPWFSAIYLLLVVSLLGCIVPRSRSHWQTLRSVPPRAPARLERLAEHLELTYDGPPAEALEVTRRALLRRRMRVYSHDGGSLSAEGGLLRETGNLVFHIAICVIVVGVAIGYLFGWRGDVIVPVGERFSSTVTSYDTFSPGPLVDAETLPPFSLKVDAMDVRFEENVGGRQLGAPRRFAATVTTRETPAAPALSQEISVNGPLELGGAGVYLLGNGYAPMITVRDASGAVLYRQATPFLPRDNNYASVGAVKVIAASPKELGFSGVFLPTADWSSQEGPRSLFPDLGDPELALSVWEGTLAPGGRPQSVYTLTTTGMTQVTSAEGTALFIRLKPGQSFELPGGRGSITFESVDRWAGLSVRVDPGKGLTLVAALAALFGLMATLLIKRRRVFVRVAPESDGGASTSAGPARAGRPGGPDGARGAAPRTVVTIGAMAKSADPALARFLASVAEDIPAVADPAVQQRAET